MKRLLLPLLLASACGPLEEDADLASDERDHALDGNPGGLVISEFKTGSEGFIEVFNACNASVDLTGWSVDDVASGGTAPRGFAAPLVIAPQAFRQVPYAGINTASKDEVRLVNAAGVAVDSHSNFWAGSSVAGLCFGRNADAGEWSTVAIPCTPGRSNGLAPPPAPAISLNEFKGGAGGWIELYNPGDAAVNLAGWSVDDVAAGGSAPRVIADNNWVAARGWMLIYYGGINTASADTVRVIDPSGDEVDRHTNFFTGSSISGRCYGRSPNGGAWSVTSVECTPAATNK